MKTIEEKVEKLIRKYNGILAILRENKSFNTPGDDYPYDLDIKNTEKYVRDLKGLLR